MATLPMSTRDLKFAAVTEPNLTTRSFALTPWGMHAGQRRNKKGRRERGRERERERERESVCVCVCEFMFGSVQLSV